MIPLHFPRGSAPLLSECWGSKSTTFSALTSYKCSIATMLHTLVGFRWDERKLTAVEAWAYLQCIRIVAPLLRCGWWRVRPPANNRAPRLCDLLKGNSFSERVSRARLQVEGNCNVQHEINRACCVMMSQRDCCFPQIIDGRLLPESGIDSRLGRPIHRRRHRLERPRGISSCAGQGTERSNAAIQGAGSERGSDIAFD